MTARAIAADVLRRSRNREGFVAELIDDAIRRGPNGPPQDRRLAVQLVMGTIRHRGTLDAVIAPYLTRPFADLHPDTLDLLRLGTYQLLFLTGIPKHAAVNETVELAPSMVTRFVNAILRRVADVVTDDWGNEAGADRVPVPLDGETSYRRLARPLLPNPRVDFPAYLAAAFSWPRWLADIWFARHGSDECLRLGAWFNAPPPLWIRVNATKISRSDYLGKLATAGIAAEAGGHPLAVRLTDGANVRDLPGYAAGEFAVQDHTSLLVSTALDPQPGWQVLDLCSAPGGKTTHLAELMQNRGRIVACDIVPERLATVTTLCQRMGATIVEPALLKDGTDAPKKSFDAVLVDAPCSNTGVLGRRPEVRWRLQPQEMEHLVALQTRLLLTAVDRVQPGGVVVYSTCSIEPAENDGVIQAALREVPRLKVEDTATSIPGRPSDGGFWARLRKG